MITKISVYSEGATDQVLEPDMAYSHLWTTVRKDGTTEQLVTLFLDKANQIATRLKNNTASNTEENLSAQFLVGIGAVVIDVLPTVPKIKQQENEEVDEEMESGENEAVGEETGSEQVAAESDMAGDGAKRTSGRKCDEKEEDDGISKDMAGGSTKHTTVDKTVQKSDAKDDGISKDMAGGSTKHTTGSKRRKCDAKEKDDGISKDMAGGSTKHTAGSKRRKSDAKETDDGISKDMAGGSTKHTAGSKRRKSDAKETDDGISKDMAGGSTKHTTGSKRRKSEAKEKDDGISKDMTGGSTKHITGGKGRKGDAKEKEEVISKGMANESDITDDSILEVNREPKDKIVLNADIIEDIEPNEDEMTQDGASNESQSDDDNDVEPQDDSSGEDVDDAPRRSTRLQLRPRRRWTKGGESDSGMNKTKNVKTERITRKKTSAKKEKSVGSFACHVPLCSSTLSSRGILITHLKGQHGYDAEAAVIAAQEWHKPRRRGPSKKSMKSVNVNVTPFVCMMECELGFLSRGLLHTHLCTIHQFTEEQSDIEIAKEFGVISSTQLPDSVFYSCHVDVQFDGTGIQEEESELKPKLACPKCEKEFEHISQARSHFINDCTSNPLQCKLCGTHLESVRGYQNHMETHENEQKGVSFPCKTCGKVFYHKYPLTQHEKIHNPGFICDLCGKASPTKILFELHKNVKHTKEKKFTCSECPKVYYSKKGLLLHISFKHGKLSEVVACHICGKMVKKFSINNHLATVHNEDDSVKCPICNKEFKHQRYLDDHTKEVHGNGGGTQYPCTWPNCDKVFTRKRSLKRHLDVHNDVRRFTCSLCPKKFRSKAHLQNHMNWHGGIKPYKCPHCEKNFLTKGNLTKHLPTHDRKKSFGGVSNNYSKHILAVTPEVTPTEVSTKSKEILEGSSEVTPTEVSTNSNEILVVNSEVTPTEVSIKSEEILVVSSEVTPTSSVTSTTMQVVPISQYVFLKSMSS
ncbi:uncharacterized protein [Amphiura filiformis]|uniref:uncharacterized protein isoform X2 n=1 Tax=Amphiura filiformis TaxID=82378 RepID=UPI003B2263B8